MGGCDWIESPPAFLSADSGPQANVCRPRAYRVWHMACDREVQFEYLALVELNGSLWPDAIRHMQNAPNVHRYAR